jgi:deoxyribodipyrimidine photolyase
MKTFLIAILGVAVLVLPAGAVAKPDTGDKHAAIKQCKAERGKTKATHQAFKAKYHSFSRCIRQNAAEEHAQKQAALKNAAKQCKAERADADFAATHDGKTFQEFYGANKNGKNAYGKCVSTKARAQKAADDEADAQQVQAFKNAAKECAAERSDAGFAAAHGGKTFEEFYGTNRNKRNAFGKCVSSKSQTYVDPFS